MYREECNKLLKQAYKLNFKSVYPTNIEKQNVTLALNIFHESTKTALSTKGFKDTASLIEIFSKWWSIVNIKNKINWFCRNNKMEMPFYSVGDERFDFLEKFCNWLVKWMELGVQNRGGSLSTDTGKALIHSTRTIIAMTKFSLQHLKVDYFLPGKLQTDKLEKRFSVYRQLSGSNYSVSVREIMDSERKIRAKSFLGIRSARYGKISLNIENLQNVCDETINDYISEKKKYTAFRNEIVSVVKESNSDTDIDASALLYVCGYISFKTASRINCFFCTGLIVGENCNDKYFQEINRGGLTIPSDYVVSIGEHVFRIMQTFVSEKYEHRFLLECDEHHSLLFSTVQEILNEDVTLKLLMDHFCECGTRFSAIITKIVQTFCNILLSNYKKRRNDKISSTKTACKARKMNTFN